MGYLSSISFRIRSALSGQDGIALLMVLVVITILTTLVVSFTETTQKHLKVTQYSKNRLQAYWAAQSGLQAATALLKMGAQASALQGKSSGADGATSPWNCESEAYQQVVPLLLANVFCESSMLEPALLLTDPNESGTEMTLSRCPSAVPILDENRKVSLFPLVTDIGTNKEATDPHRFDHLTYLLQYLLKESDFATGEEGQATGITLALANETKIDKTEAEKLAGYLVDWIDTENSTTTDPLLNSDTAEQSCPADDLPYEAKNGLLDSIDEIGLVCGFRQLPRTTIERLTRHLTAYDLETNINTATYPVLHALCAAEEGDEDEAVSEGIFQTLHFSADDESIDKIIITDKNAYTTVLADFERSLRTYLKKHTAFASDHFRVGVYGLVYNTESATVLARARLQMDLKKRGTTGSLLPGRLKTRGCGKGKRERRLAPESPGMVKGD